MISVSSVMNNPGYVPWKNGVGCEGPGKRRRRGVWRDFLASGFLEDRQCLAGCQLYPCPSVPIRGSESDLTWISHERADGLLESLTIRFQWSVTSLKLRSKATSKPVTFR